jgi:WD40 repeat protein
MIRRTKLFIVLIGMFLVSASIAAAQPDVMQIPVPGRAIVYAVSPDGASAALYPNAALVREEPPTGAFVQMIDLVTGGLTQALTDLPDWVSDAAYLPDGRLLTAHLNGDFILWDVEAGAIERQWWTGLLQSRLRISPDGARAFVMVPGTFSTMFEMDLETGALLRALGRHSATLFEILEGQGDIERRGDYTFVDFALSPDGASLAYANADGEIFVSDLESEAFTLARERSEQPMAFDARSLRFAPDGESLFYLQFARDARQVMQVAPNSAVIATYGESVYAYAFSADASRIAWVERSEDDWRIMIQDAVGGEAEVVFDLREAGLAVSPIPTLSFAADGTRLLLDVNPADGDDEQAILLVIPIE